MRILKALRVLAVPAVVAAIVVAAVLSRDRWLPLLKSVEVAAEKSDDATPAPVEKPEILVSLQSYWRTVQIPGVIVDRPGKSDRGITSPAVGVVTQIHAFPGDTVRAGDRLFSLRLFSEYLQKTQKELFEASRETELVQAQINRLRPLSETGSIAPVRIIELENELKRQAAVIESHRQDLLTRGLSPDQIAVIASGKFVSTVEIKAPEPVEIADAHTAAQAAAILPVLYAEKVLAYEIQELAVDLGQQVQAGQLLATLANHQSLYIEGHAFKREAPALEQAAQKHWELTIEFAEDDPEGWPGLTQPFHIRHLSNSIDASSRTFDFLVPLENQSRSYESEGETFVVWRFRPGQRVRLHVPVEKLENVFVLPAESVVRDGPEAYIFRQNGDLFNRIAVQVLHEDRLNVVLANDGSIRPGLYFAQNAAASLNRVLKAQASSGMQPGVHVHADGTVHAAH